MGVYTLGIPRAMARWNGEPSSKVFPQDDLADVGAPQLRDHPAGEREDLEPLCCLEEAFCHEAAVTRRIPADELADGPKIPSRLIRPPDRTHPKTCFRASSLLSVSPASAWRRPSSTLARK